MVSITEQLLIYKANEYTNFQSIQKSLWAQLQITSSKNEHEY